MDDDIDQIILERVRLNDSEVHAATMIQKGDWIEYQHLREDEQPLADELKVIFEDESIIAVSKPDYLPVTPSTSFYFNSLAIQVKEHLNCKDVSPVHRLDIETSGVLLFGKSKKIRRQIQMMFQDHSVSKIYQAIVFNNPEHKEISGDLVPDESSQIYTKLKLVESQQANSLTLILKKEEWGEFSRLWLKPITGKTNQIRAHLAAIGCPIVGDKKYYPDESIFLDWFKFRDINRLLPKIKLPRQALHCESLTFIHPTTQQRIKIEDTTNCWSQKIESLLCQ